MSMDELSEKWRQRVQEELDPEEQVLWMGSPDPARTAGRPLSTPAGRVGLVTFATAVAWVLLAAQLVGPPRPGYPWFILLPALFPAGTGAGQSSVETKAKPEIWTNWSTFQSRASDYAAATAKLADLAKAGDTPGFTAQLDVVKKSCDACHSDFKARWCGSGTGRAGAY